MCNVCIHNCKPTLIILLSQYIIMHIEHNRILCKKCAAIKKYLLVRMKQFNDSDLLSRHLITIVLPKA